MNQFLFYLFMIFSVIFSTQSMAEDTSKPKNVTADGRTIIEKNRKIPPIDTINVMGVGTLVINQSNSQSLDLEGEDKILPLVEVSVKDSALFIELKESAVEEGTKIKYQLNIKDIKAINTFGSTSVDIPKTLEAKNLKVVIRGSGDSSLKLAVEKLDLSINGGTKVTALGEANDQFIDIQGAGVFQGTQLSGKNMKVTIRGAGAAYSQVSDTLNIDIAGVGDVKYCQKPEITKKVNGTSNIVALPEKECQL